MTKPRDTYEKTIRQVFCDSTDFISLATDLHEKVRGVQESKVDRQLRPAREMVELLEGQLASSLKEQEEFQLALHGYGDAETPSRVEYRNYLAARVERATQEMQKAAVRLDEEKAALVEAVERAAYSSLPEYWVVFPDGRERRGHAVASDILQMHGIGEAKEIKISVDPWGSDSGYSLLLHRGKGLEVMVFSDDPGLYKDLENTVLAKAGTLTPSWAPFVYPLAFTIYFYLLTVFAIIAISSRLDFAEETEKLSDSANLLLVIFAGALGALAVVVSTRLVPRFAFLDIPPKNLKRNVKMFSYVALGVVVPSVFSLIIS